VDGGDAAGTYAQSRASDSDLTKLIKLAGASIGPDADGHLVMRAGGQVTRWRQIEPLVFAQVDGRRRLVFRENDRGEIVDACTSPNCVIVMQKQPWFLGTAPQLVWLGVCVAILAAAAIGFPIAAVLQRKIQTPRGASLARFLAWATCLVLVSGLVGTIAGMSDINGTVLFGLPARALELGLGLFVVGAVLSAGVAGMTLLAWRRQWWHAAGRVCMTLVCMAALGVVAWLHYWNLLGWRY
jgi:hypothetical protein